MAIRHASSTLRPLSKVAAYSAPRQERSRLRPGRAGLGVVAIAGVLLSASNFLGTVLPRLSEASRTDAQNQEVDILKAYLQSGYSETATVGSVSVSRYNGKIDISRLVETIPVNLHGTPHQTEAGMDNTTLRVGNLQLHGGNKRVAEAGGIVFDRPLIVRDEAGGRWVGGILADKKGHTPKATSAEQLAKLMVWADQGLMQQGGEAYGGVRVTESPAGTIDTIPMSVALSNGHLIAADGMQAAVINLMPPVEKLPETYSRQTGA